MPWLLYKLSTCSPSDTVDMGDQVQNAIKNWTQLDLRFCCKNEKGDNWIENQGEN